MLLEVKNIQGCKSARINLPPGEVVMLSGPNESGKSSVLLALRALLALDPDPAGKGKTKQKSYTRFGTDESYARLSMGQSTYEWRPGEGIDESGDTRKSGLPVSVPVLNPTALNLPSLADRQAAWTATLGVVYTAQAVSDALVEATEMLPNGKKVHQTLIDMLFGEGVEDTATAWKQVETYARDHKLGASRDWAKIVANTAGEKKSWTKKQGASWRPPNFPIEAEGKTLKAAIDEEQQAAEKYAAAEREHMRTYMTPAEMTATQAELKQAEQAERDAKKRLNQLEDDFAGESAGTYKEWDSARTRVENHRKADVMIAELEKAIQRGRDFEKSGKHKSQPAKEAGLQRCPHCNGWLTLGFGNEIVAAEPVAAVETNEDYDKLANNTALLEEWHKYKASLLPYPKEEPPPAGTRVKLPDDLAAQRGLYAQCVRQTKELRDKLNKAYVAEDSTAPETVGELGDALEAKRNIVSCIKAQQDAEAAHTRASLWEQIWQQLKPSGLRHRLIQGALEDVNETLEDFAETANWPEGRLRIDLKTLQLFCGPVPFEDFSTSQKMRVTAALAVILAYQVESPVAVIDNFDVLVGFDEPLDTASGMFDALSNIAEATEIAVLGAVATFDTIGDYHSQRGVFAPVTDGTVS